MSAISLPTFDEIRRVAANQSDALNRYAGIRTAEFDRERATKMSRDGTILEATWKAYRSANASIQLKDIALILLTGNLWVTEEQEIVEFQTYHPATLTESGGLARMIAGGLVEGAGIISGLAAITLLIVGGWSWIAGGSENLLQNALLVFGGILSGFVARVVIRKSRVIRIPRAIVSDESSPFYLTRIRKTNIRQGGS